MNQDVLDISIAAGLFALLAVALEAGYRAGRRATAEGDPRASGQVGAIQAALLGLLGLLLAFSFSAAGSRFLERQDLIVAEANAIGTAYLRADLVDEPHRSELRGILRDYTAHRIAVTPRLRNRLDHVAELEIQQFHARMWAAALAGVRARPEVLVGVLPPVNEVIDVHATRVSAGRKHLPPIIMGLLIACSALAVGVIGYGCGTGGRRRAPLTVPLAVVISIALWITIDLDHPRAGLMQLSDAPLSALKFE